MKTAERKDIVPSMASNVIGKAFTVEQMLNYSVQAIWMDLGSLSGAIKLQGSNDAYEPPLGNALYLIENPNAIWQDVPSSTITVTGSNSQVYDVAEVGYRYYRLVYTASAGNGSMVVNHWAKGRI